MPPLFINQLVHVILRNALDGCDDAVVLRAAELFFRTAAGHRCTKASLIAADEETIAGANPTPVSPLVSMLGIPAEAEIDVLNDDNAGSYWERSDQFDMALDLTAGRRGSRGAGAGDAALDRASARRSTSAIEPLHRAARRQISPGMSGSMPTRPGSAICCGTAKSSTKRRMARVVGLFRLTFPDPASCSRRSGANRSI